MSTCSHHCTTTSHVPEDICHMNQPCGRHSGLGLRKITFTYHNNGQMHLSDNSLIENSPNWKGHLRKIVQTCCWNEISVTFHFEHLVAFAASVSVSLANVFLVKLASLDRGVIIKIMTSGGLPATVAASSRVFLNGLFPQRRLPTVGWASSLEENFKACISDNTLERLKKPDRGTASIWIHKNSFQLTCVYGWIN